jgi:hypothetical protein
MSSALPIPDAALAFAGWAKTTVHPFAATVEVTFRFTAAIFKTAASSAATAAMTATTL